MGKLPAKDRFQLLALSCILIAAKYLGPEEEVPPISEFWEFGNRCYSYDEIHEMELLTLSKYVPSPLDLLPMDISIGDWAGNSLLTHSFVCLSPVGCVTK